MGQERPMPRKNTTKTTSTAKKKAARKPKPTKPKPATAPPKRAGLRPKSALGRGLLTMIRLYLEEDGDWVDSQNAQGAVLAHGFLHRSQYGLAHTSVAMLERDISMVLVSDQDGYDASARDEASQLAAALVERVFGLKHQPLKELVPEVVTALESEAAAEQKAKARPKPQAARKGGAAKATKKQGKKTSGPKAPKRATGKGRAPAGPREQQEEVSSAAAPTGADDPAYAIGLAHLRTLGNHVDEDYAVDELADELDVTLYRAEAMLQAMKAKGDWPQGAKPDKTLDQRLEEGPSDGDLQPDAASPTSRLAGPPPQIRPMGKGSKRGEASRTTDELRAATERFVAEQKRLGRKPTPSGLKKALGVGHDRASSLLAAVQ
jgi:hypothetical protein